MPNEYETKLQEWKERHGVGYMRDVNQDELLMAAEESQAKGKSWCFGCDKHMPIKEMKLITRTIDPYMGITSRISDYAAAGRRSLLFICRWESAGNCTPKYEPRHLL